MFLPETSEGSPRSRVIPLFIKSHTAFEILVFGEKLHRTLDLSVLFQTGLLIYPAYFLSLYPEGFQ
jgi:hypothetical protein